MVTRTEAAAATRVALVRAASELLDAGGPEAVTLRAVGTRAGLSRGAPYGHFDSKEQLLTAVAVEIWNSLAEQVAVLRTEPQGTPISRLERALSTLIDVARDHPHRYSLMFSTPADDPQSAAAASRLQNEFLAIVGDVVGPLDALRYGALLMSSAHGIASMELSGHLTEDKWGVNGDQLVQLLVAGIQPPSTSGQRPT